MTMPNAAHKVRPARVKVGDRVGVSVGGRLLAATVLEDRGNLGARGQQVVRLAVGDPIIPGETFEVELPVDWLLPAPVRRAARR